MLNRQELIGRLGKAPELRHTPSGRACCRFSVATSERWKDKDGETKEETQWHNVIAWGKLGELCAQHLDKGRLVYVEGSTKHRSFDDKDGNKRYVTEVIAREVKFLDSRQGGAAADQGDSYEDDDISF